MPRLFLHYFYNHPQDKARWISLIWLPKHPLFHLFTSSYKNFKIGYFKATTRPIAGKDYFYDLEGILCFPSIDNNVLNSTTSTQRSY